MNFTDLRSMEATDLPDTDTHSQTPRNSKGILSVIPESTLKLMTPRNAGKITRKELRHINNACGVQLSVRFIPSSAETKAASYEIRAPHRTSDEKQRQILIFLKQLSELALQKGRNLLKKEVEDCWKNLPPIAKAPTLPALATATVHKSSTRAPSWLYLTPIHVSALVLERLGSNQSLVPSFIADHFQGLRPQLVDGRIAIDQHAIDHMLIRYPNTVGTLSSCFLAFVELAEKGPLNTTNLHQVLEKIRSHMADGLGGIVERTLNGKKIDLKDISLSALDGSLYFDSTVTQRTSEEDPAYTPNQTLLFRNKVFLQISREDRNKFIEKIGKKAGVVSINTSTEGFLIKGSLEQVEIARDYLIKFVTLIAERNYKKPAQLEQALLHVFGEISLSELPQTKAENGKGGTNSQTFDISSIPLHKLELLSPNQATYLSLLSDDNVPCLLTHGPAGTGKTRLFLQTAMQKIFDHHSGKPNSPFHKLIISIPLVNVGGKELGALPGDLSKKTESWFDTYYNHLTRILSPHDVQGEPDLAKGAKYLEQLIATGIIEIAPLEFLRGKSFAGALVALDEAQNATPAQMRTFLTRAEKTSRLFAFGDVGQFDRRPQHDETFFVPSTVRIDDRGMVSIDIHGDETNLGFHSDIGHFKLSADGKTLETIAPNNGFVKALILSTASRHVQCAHLDKSDIHRSDVTFDILALEEEFRATGGEMGSRPPTGVGKEEKDPRRALGHAHKEAFRDRVSMERYALPKPTLN